LQSGFCIEFVIKTTAFSLLTQVYGFVLCFSLLRGTSAKSLYFFENGNGLPTHFTVLAMTRRRLAAHSTMVAIAKRYVILSAEHERIRNSSFKRERIAAHLTAVSPAGSVGASASQRCPPDTRTAMTDR